MLKISPVYGGGLACKVRVFTLTNALHFKNVSLELPKIGNSNF